MSPAGIVRQPAVDVHRSMFPLAVSGAMFDALESYAHQIVEFIRIHQQWRRGKSALETNQPGSDRPILERSKS